PREHLLEEGAADEKAGAPAAEPAARRGERLVDLAEIVGVEPLAVRRVRDQEAGLDRPAALAGDVGDRLGREPRDVAALPRDPIGDAGGAGVVARRGERLEIDVAADDERIGV